MDKFNELKQLIDEYNSLSTFFKDLNEESHEIAIIQTNYDGPGINYNQYSSEIKSVILKSINNRMAQIEKQINDNNFNTK